MIDPVDRDLEWHYQLEREKEDEALEAAREQEDEGSDE